MLKSTYKPSAAAAAAAAPLPPGWTEHKAPTGHVYYYNAETKESTYRRPGQPVQQPAQQPASVAYTPYPNVPNLSDPRVANAYLAQLNPSSQQPSRGGRGGGGRGGRGGRGGFDGRPRPQPTDKPRRKEAIPGHEPWMLVYTKCSRRFAYNPAKNASYWRIPEKLMPAILELDKARVRGNAAGEKGESDKTEAAPVAKPERVSQPDLEGDSSEYEEVEVTDDEADSQHPSKRPRTDDDGDDADDQREPDGPVEFTEADIAAQLQMMGDEYGLEPGDYDDGNMHQWPEGAEGVEFSEEDARHLFRDLLNDFNINPYSPWEKLLEEGKIVDDPRYTALTTTKARKDCWDQWSRDKIAQLKEQRARQETKDPRVAYMAFLQDKATPKLYWPEFKRKYKKLEPMRDAGLSDKEREKTYREHVSRLKMAPATLKADLTALLRAQPASLLHCRSLSSGGLPAQVLADVRYISLAPAVRDPLVEAYVQTLPPPPEDAQGGGDAPGDAEQARKEREARERRGRALRERDRVVEEQRRRRERDVAASKARLREAEREIDRAMQVDRRGLQSQLEGQ